MAHLRRTRPLRLEPLEGCDLMAVLFLADFSRSFGSRRGIRPSDGLARADIAGVWTQPLVGRLRIDPGGFERR